MIETTGDPTTTSVSKTDLSEIDRHRLLANGYRRAALEVVSERTRSIGLEELVTEVEERLDSSEAEHDSERELRILLHHKHVPILASTGVIDYDHDRNRVVL